MHKLYRVLEKSNYFARYPGRDPPSLNGREPQRLSGDLQAKLETGCPSTYGRILKYLAFESSSAFISYLKNKGVNMELQYLIESKFIRELAKVLMDLFKYRVALAPE